MRLVPADKLAREVEQSLSMGQRIAVLSRYAPSVDKHLLWQQAAIQAAPYAHDLYARLRMLDQAGVDLILVEAPPRETEWLAVNDRLSRAAHGAGA